MEHVGLLDAFSIVAKHHWINPASIMATVTVLNYIHARIEKILENNDRRRKNRSHRRVQASILRIRTMFRQVRALFPLHHSMKQNSRRSRR